MNGSDHVTYEELLVKSERDNLIVKEKDIPGYGGRIYKNRIAIHKGLRTQTEKACVLAEERGHHFTTSGDIVDQTDIQNRKQEFRARMWAYNEMIGLLGIVNAYKNGCRNSYEAAEYLEVTEEFLNDALNAYRAKYGVYTIVDNYAIYFIPTLLVLERK